jgi:hypothetical protein
VPVASALLFSSHVKNLGGFPTSVDTVVHLYAGRTRFTRLAPASLWPRRRLMVQWPRLEARRSDDLTTRSVAVALGVFNEQSRRV